jgi:hypothetical protein
MEAWGGDDAQVALGGWGHDESGDEGKAMEVAQVNHNGGMWRRRHSGHAGRAPASRWR